MVRILWVSALLCAPALANKLCSPTCSPGYHCLKGECVSATPHKNKCYNDIDCHPGFCGSDGLCHQTIDRKEGASIEKEYQIDQKVDNAARE